MLEAARRQSFQSYERFWKDLAKERPNAFTSDGALHQVGGVGHPWQDPVEVDCVKYADDDYHNHPMEKAWFDLVRSRDAPPNEWPDFEEQWEARSAFTARERVTHFARADSWQLVLQIESDSEVGPWTLEGCLYVCIRKSDLAERRSIAAGRFRSALKSVGIAPGQEGGAQPQSECSAPGQEEA